MKVGIMQPYLFPYIGYFQLIASVDKFVVYDNIQYTKKGWINRNRILVNGKDAYFTIPLKKDSDFKSIIERNLAETQIHFTTKIVNRLEATYGNAPYFKVVFPILKTVFLNNESNLFKYIHFSLLTILNYLEIHTDIIVASTIDINHNLKSQDKVLAICEKLKADEYINPIGGTALYSRKLFKEQNISLSFLQSESIKYKQFDNDFIPWLSIIDVMMFNSKEKIQDYIKQFSLH